MVRCLYCGEMTIRAELASGDFCSPEHQDAYARNRTPDVKHPGADPVSEWKWLWTDAAPAKTAVVGPLPRSPGLAAPRFPAQDYIVAPVELTEAAHRGLVAPRAGSPALPSGFAAPRPPLLLASAQIDPRLPDGCFPIHGPRAGLFRSEQRGPLPPSDSSAPRPPVLLAGPPIELRLPDYSAPAHVRLERWLSFPGSRAVLPRRMDAASRRTLQGCRWIEFETSARDGRLTPPFSALPMTFAVPMTAYPPFEGVVELAAAEFPPFILDLPGAPLGPRAADCYAAATAALLPLRRGAEKEKVDPQLPPFRSIPIRILPASCEPVFSYLLLPLTRGASKGRTNSRRATC